MPPQVLANLRRDQADPRCGWRCNERLPRESLRRCAHPLNRGTTLEMPALEVVRYDQGDRISAALCQLRPFLKLSEFGFSKFDPAHLTAVCRKSRNVAFCPLARPWRSQPCLPQTADFRLPSTDCARHAAPIYCAQLPDNRGRRPYGDWRHALAEVPFEFPFVDREENARRRVKNLAPTVWGKFLTCGGAGR